MTKRRAPRPKEAAARRAEFERLREIAEQQVLASPRGALDAYLPGGSQWTGALQQEKPMTEGDD